MLYSQKLNKYYIGATQDSLEERLRRHISSKLIGFTSTVDDWKMVYFEQFESYSEALKREKEIKANKSRRYIEFLISSKE